MENFVFYSPTEFVFGRDTQKQAGELVKRHGGTKVMIVSGGSSAEKSGLLAQVRASLDEAGIPYVEQKGIKPNPTDTGVYEGIGIARNEHIDFLLAVGGGSVIDSAKAVALGTNYDGDFWDYYCGKAKVPVPGTLPVGVVLTIPAAGSEGSGNSVITRESGHNKISVRYPMHLRPRFAVMNPELTMTLPWFQTACGIVDMLCHICERYFSNTVAPVPDALGASLMKEIMRNALILKDEPDNYEARAAIMWASTLAHNGICGTGKEEDWSSHRLEHELSAWYNVAHGAGLAVMLPAWLTFVGRKNPAKVAEFAVDVLGISPENKTKEMLAVLAVELLREFFRTLEMPMNLKELIGSDPDINLLVGSLQNNMGNTLGFYVPLSMKDCRDIYRIAQRASAVF